MEKNEIDIDRAKLIAQKYQNKFPTRKNVVYIGEKNGNFYFAYRKYIEKGGHCGCPIYASVNKTGAWKLLEDDWDITNAILLSCEGMQRNL